MRILLRDGFVDLGDGVVHRGEDVRLGEAERRLLAALTASPGQVVARDALLALTETPSANALDRLVARTRGKVELDPKEPEHLITAYGVGYRWVPPTVAVASDTFPALKGRDADIVALRAAVASGDPVSVIGPGGVGKTALVRSLYPDARWVDLASAHDAEDVVRLVGAALGNPRSDAAWVAATLRAHPETVVFDNAETVPDVVASRVDRWRADAPHSTFIVTSRVPVGASGERIVPLGPLAPHVAAALYIERAARRGVVVDDGPYLRELVRALDGLPLAIELAAAQSDEVAPEWALEQIREGGLDVSSATWRDVPERHTSLDHAVAWSWDLLEAADQRALVALSLPYGWFGLDFAEATLGNADALDVVHRLVLNGLVQVDREKGEIRLFEAVRRFAAARATEVPDLEQERARQIAWIGERLAPKSNPLTITIAVPVVLASRGPQAAALAARLTLLPVSTRAGVALAEFVLRHSEEPEARARAWIEIARGRRYLGHEEEARAAALEAVAGSTARWLGLAWMELAHAERQLGAHEQAEACFRRALDLALPLEKAEVAHGLASFFRTLGRTDEAKPLYEYAAAGYEQFGREHMANACRLSALDGEPPGEATIARIDQIMARMRETGAPANRLAFAHAWRGLAVGRTGRWAEAAVELEQAAIALREQEHDVPWVEVQGYRAWTLELQGHPEAADAMLEHTGRGLRGYLAGLITLWRALLLARRRDPAAAATLAEARAAVRVPEASQYGLWMRVAQAWMEGNEAAVRELATSGPAGRAALLPFGIWP